MYDKGITDKKTSNLTDATIEYWRDGKFIHLVTKSEKSEIIKMARHLGYRAIDWKKFFTVITKSQI